MAIINPLLLAGPEQIRRYQEQRIKDWTDRKGESSTDFEHYFSEIANQWEMDEFNETILDVNEFEDIDGLDLEASQKIQDALKKSKVLNSDGFLDIKNFNIENILSALDEFPGLSNEQKDSIASRLEAILNHRPQDFETFTKSMFTYEPVSNKQKKFTITENESHKIWDQLNDLNIIDNYGVLLLKPKSAELESAINGLTVINNDQKERVLGILNQHPELSYRSYLNNLTESSDPDSILPTPGLYFGDGVPVKKINGLSKEQLNYIRIMAVLEWNVLLMSQKSIHKTRKRSIENIKKAKKQEKQENEQFLAQLEAKYRQQAKQKTQKKK